MVNNFRRKIIMKKILSVVLVLAMVLALGVTAFAAENTKIEAGKTVGMTFAFDTTNGVKLSDTNGLLVFGEPVVAEGVVHVNVTAPAGTAGKITQIVVADKDGKNAVKFDVVEVTAPAAAPAPTPEGVLTYAMVDADPSLVDTKNNVATVDMNGYNGIDAALYNALKTANFEKIVFAGEGYTWTLTRGDYTKMNVTAAIYFGVEADVNLWTLDKDKNDVVDTATENAVLKALGNTKADVFYVTINDNVNIGNVASKPELVVDLTEYMGWINFNNKFSVTAYKFDGETVAKVAEGLAVKPATNRLTLNLTNAGTYVFVADNHTVNPTTPSDTQKPNAGTGANSAAAVVAIAVMAVAAVASKKIVK